MIVSAIAAMSRTGVIGDGVKMPWHLPRDLRRFRDSTMGKPVIMGRRTLESLRGPLPGRLNIALTHSASYRAEGFRIARSIDDAIRIAEEQGGDHGEVMVIGGGVVYQDTAPLWDRLLLTVVEGEFPGGTYFPLAMAKEERWRLVRQEYCAPDSKNAHAHWFLSLERENASHLEAQRFDLSTWLNTQPAPIAG
ncbi:dihydrofolate reductase [Singulisphaera acidiphila]|uniref:Dihydrofolate reductase n=1 Tax=Singulisphaera acidiphila (strain ATCC BAA-1392 / DSM 18658 / VKM B-2454 / MOB10) TaxID=886293 RepID=L0DGN0_SINAD|nr:dihydrofolate reductase [Singulisphaera acidiphila]AGA27831.1 dihydrofolate reductase [Singulisphaera acidiphila DSM 18658]